MKRSSRGMEELLELGFAAGGVLPPSKGYVWRNLPLDVGHVLAYFVAHEAHHRGQIVMVARQLDQRLPRAATIGCGGGARRHPDVRKGASRRGAPSPGRSPRLKRRTIKECTR